MFATNPLFRFRCNLRTRMYLGLRRIGQKKRARTIPLLGCSFEELRQHIESQFEPWMKWDNYGNHSGYAKSINVSWDIDHKIPLASAAAIEEIEKLFHYSNLRPMCSFTNRVIKRDRLEEVK